MDYLEALISQISSVPFQEHVILGDASNFTIRLSVSCPNALHQAGVVYEHNWPVVLFV